MNKHLSLQDQTTEHGVIEGKIEEVANGSAH